jgi:hypothetical protein
MQKEKVRIQKAPLLTSELRALLSAKARAKGKSSYANVLNIKIKIKQK